MASRNLILGILFGMAAATGAAANPILRWSPSNPGIDIGEEITLSVMLEDPLTVRTIDLVIQFDPAVLTSLSGAPGALFDGLQVFPGFVATGPGTWRGYCVVLGASDWATGPGELFRWTVRGEADGITQLETLELTLLPPGGGDYPNATLVTGVVRVGDVVSAPLDVRSMPMLSLFPNPFNPRTRVAFSLPAAGPARVDVYDLRGRTVRTLWQGSVGAEPIHLDWDGTDATGRVLPSGVYRFLLRGDDGVRIWRSGLFVR